MGNEHEFRFPLQLCDSNDSSSKGVQGPWQNRVHFYNHMCRWNHIELMAKSVGGDVGIQKEIDEMETISRNQ